MTTKAKQSPIRRLPQSYYVGTSYFVSFPAALRYYRPYGFDRAAVQQKLDEGEIHIGKPPVKAGETLSLIDGRTRYQITTEAR